jgi:pimeloyl-ACP methyl ester carboxylesterase
MTDIKLPDGRFLAFSEYGNPNGKPVFFFHRMPGSRFFRPADVSTTRLGVRLICVDRPGYGESTFQPGRRILNWPQDIAHLANSLGIQQFYLAGHSGGGPYALACAFALPKRVIAVTVLSGAGPIDTPNIGGGMSVTNRFGLTVGRFIPWPLWQTIVWVVYHRRAADPAADIDRGTGNRPIADEEQLRNPEAREACVRSEVEAFRHGLRGMPGMPTCSPALGAFDWKIFFPRFIYGMEPLRTRPQFPWHDIFSGKSQIAELRSVKMKPISYCFLIGEKL